MDEYLQKLETLQTSVENKTCTLEQVWQLIESPFLTNDVTSLELQQEKLIDEPQWDKSYFFECCATLKEHLLRLKINSNTQTSQNVQISTTLSEVSDHYLTAHKTNIEKSQSPKWLFFNNFTPEGDSLHSMLLTHSSDTFAPLFAPILFAAKSPVSAEAVLFRTLLGLENPLDSCRFSLISDLFGVFGLSVQEIYLNDHTKGVQKLWLGAILVASELVPSHTATQELAQFPGSQQDFLPGISEDHGDDEDDMTFGELMGSGVYHKLENLAELYAKFNQPGEDDQEKPS